MFGGASISQRGNADEGGLTAVINRIADFHAEMVQWRPRMHAHSETAFVDPIVVAAQIITGLQTITSRAVTCTRATAPSQAGATEGIFAYSVMSAKS